MQRPALATVWLAYEVGTEAGRYPAMGSTTLDRAGHALHERLRAREHGPARPEDLRIDRTDFVPDGRAPW